MAVLTPHWDALTSETRQAFRIAASLPAIQRYYLAGGYFLGSFGVNLIRLA